MPASYILTTFSPAMFGEKATIHIKAVERAEAEKHIDRTTRTVATRVSHERLAKTQFPGSSDELARYANFKPNTCAILLSYRGPPVPDTGEVPTGGSVMFYLIEVEEYQET
jgi:hypothetical protein